MIRCIFILCILLQIINPYKVFSFTQEKKPQDKSGEEAGFRAGIKGGLNLSFIQNNSGNSSDFNGGEGGLAMEFVFGKIVSLEIDFMYQQRGGIVSDNTRELNFWAVPVIIKASKPILGGKNGDSGILSPILGLGISTQFLSSARSGNNRDSTIKNKNVSILILLGIKLSSGNDKTDFIFEWRYEQGLTDIGTSEVIRTRNHSIIFGTMFKIF